jgi:hypothetical protein
MGAKEGEPVDESESESDRARWRRKRVLELRAQGLSFTDIGAQVNTVRGDVPHPMGARRARLTYTHALRVLHHPGWARQLAQYLAHGTYDD